jgi:prolyl-tRNA synthetase
MITLLQRFLLLTLLLLSLHGFSQTISGKSSPVRVDVGHTKPSPQASLAYTQVSFKDANQNEALEALEKGTIRFIIRNTGKVTSQNLIIWARTSEDDKGFLFREPLQIPAILPGKTREVQIPVTGTNELEAGMTTLIVEIKEEMEFETDQIEINVIAKQVDKP